MDVSEFVHLIIQFELNILENFYTWLSIKCCLTIDYLVNSFDILTNIAHQMVDVGLFFFILVVVPILLLLFYLVNFTSLFLEVIESYLGLSNRGL